MQRRIEQITTGGVPDRERTQQVLTEEFVGALLLRGGETPDQIVTRFGEQHSGVLSWLGETRQDAILRDAMEQTGIDLNSWISQKKGQ